MVIRARSEIVQAGDVVQLRALFRGPDGLPADLDSFPSITITQPSGNILVGPTSAGVYRLSSGLYGWDLSIDLYPTLGVWADQWGGVLNGLNVTGTFNFTVLTTQVPVVNQDGYESIGDDPGFNYSQTAIHNINKLLKTLKARLNSSGKMRTTDKFGNVVYEDCDIFDVNTLVTFLATSLTYFNEVPHVTFYCLDDTPVIDQFHDLLVQGALIQCLASKQIIERGAEFNLSDSGVSFQPPLVSEVLGSQYAAEMTQHMERLRYLKICFKPSPLGAGLLSVGSGASPALRRLRHLRERRIL